jgi:TatD DNase family protein
MVTYKNAGDLRGVAAAIPAERLLVETDCPYLAPVPLRGKRNEPAFVAHTAAALAELRGVPADEFAEQTTRNAKELFGTP